MKVVRRPPRRLSRERGSVGVVLPASHAPIRRALTVLAASQLGDLGLHELTDHPRDALAR